MKLLLSIKITCVIVSTCIVLSALPSCRLSPASDSDAVKPAPLLTEKMKQRAGEFRAKFEKVPEIAVFIADNELDFYEELPEVAAERLSLLGINLVYFNIELTRLCTGSEARKLRALVASLTRKNIESALVISEKELLPLFARKPIADKTMKNIVKTIEGYNSCAAKGEHFRTVVFELAPHRINARMANPPEGLLFIWGDKSFGADRDNDKLMCRTLSLIESFRDQLPEMRIRIITEDFYHELRTADKISVGTVDDLLKFSEAVIIETRQASPASTIDAVRNELTGAGRPNSIIIKVMTSRRLFGTAGENSWSRDHWDELLKNSEELVAACKKYPAWRGVVFDSFGGLERCWER